MARKRKTEPPLTSRQGKVLRFVVSRSSGVHQAPVEPGQTVNYIDWSDLPHSVVQAVKTFQTLKSLKLIEAIDGGYQATEEGMTLIQQANENGWWRK